MEKVELREGGLRVSPVVAGVWKWGKWGHKLTYKEQEELIKSCRDLGVTTFDHADIYGDHEAEEEFGRVLKNNAGLRGELELITKCGIRMPSDRFDYDLKSYDTSDSHIALSVENSLRHFGTDYLDLLLIHRPSPLMDADEIADTVDKLKDQGKILHFGVSNFTPAQFELLNSRTPLSTNQVQASLLHREPVLDGTFDQLAMYRVRPMAWSPLGGGGLFSGTKTETIASIAAEARAMIHRYDGIERLDQLYLAWLMRHPAGPVPILGTAKPERVEAAVNACGISMSREDWFRLWTAATGREVP